MSLDFYYDAMDSLRKGGFPFILVCSPKGAEESQISFSEEILTDFSSAEGVMESIDLMYETLYTIHEEAIEEQGDEDEDDC